jgi:L-lysine 2,3-aminomutase
VDDSAGAQLVEQMRNCLPGYLVPRLVRELAGRSSKTIIG